MSPAAGLMLVQEIVPRIQAAVPRTVKPIGAEDFREIVADTIVLAANMVESCEVRGRPLYPSSIAYFAIQAVRHGRRSTSASRTDAMSPAAQLDGNATLDSMDESVEAEDGDALSLHELLAGPAEDPAQIAGRELDWAELMEDLTERDLALLRTTINGDRLDLLARQFGVTPARVTQLKRELGQQIQLRWGTTVLEDVTRAPAWAGSINASHERQACRHERSKQARVS